MAMARTRDGLWLFAAVWMMSLGVLIGVTDRAVQARSLEEILQTGEIRFCIADIDPSVAVAQPEGCRDDCTFTGPAYDAALAFSKTLGEGIKPAFVRVGWEEQFHNKEGVTDREGTYTPELLASETCDIYPSHLTKLPWRSKKLDFVILFPSRMMVVVHKRNKRKFKKAKDLAGKVAAVTKDTSFHTWLQEQNQSTYKDQPIKLQLIQGKTSASAVAAGEADFAFLDGDMAIFAINRKFKNMALAFPVGPVHELGWGFRKADKALQARVKQYFESEKKATYSETNKRWKDTYGLSLQDFVRMVTKLN